MSLIHSYGLHEWWFSLAGSLAGKGPLRAHTGVMAGLRALKTDAMSDAARRSASAALFELDEEARQKAKEAVVAAKAAMAQVSGAPNSGGSGDVEHVMLSYNWGHQGVIKRLNTALKARSYSVWIDIEKMQGSTVEAMSEAVEECAVMCYGISQAYKESTNCRMEAQYAHQQEKDMVREASACFLLTLYHILHITSAPHCHLQYSNTSSVSFDPHF